jgi:hypothetical protein
MKSFYLTPKSRNRKTGPIPVTTSDMSTCPSVCPLLDGGGCYASSGPLGATWRAISSVDGGQPVTSGVATMRTLDWDSLCQGIAGLPDDTLWRHNQAGDLPHKAKTQTIDSKAVDDLVKANRGRRGFTYTHHNMNIKANRTAVAKATGAGFTINLSANNLDHADKLAALAIAPVAVVLQSDEKRKSFKTPAGNTVTVCPATYRDDIACINCELCQRTTTSRSIVGFPAHGAKKATVNHIARRNITNV